MKKKHSQYWLGKKRSEETKKKISESVKLIVGGKNNPMYGKKHTEEAKRKNSLAHKGKVSPRKGVKLSKETIEKMMKSRAETFSGKPTSIERKLYSYLRKNCIVFEQQKPIGRFLVDAYIPSFNLVIEADGIYWHKLDKIIKKDKAENAYLLKCGYRLLRIWETDFNSGKYLEILNNIFVSEQDAIVKDYKLIK